MKLRPLEVLAWCWLAGVRGVRCKMIACCSGFDWLLPSLLGKGDIEVGGQPPPQTQSVIFHRSLVSSTEGALDNNWNEMKGFAAEVNMKRKCKAFWKHNVKLESIHYLSPSTHRTNRWSNLLQRPRYELKVFFFVNVERILGIIWATISVSREKWVHDGCSANVWWGPPAKVHVRVVTFTTYIVISLVGVNLINAGYNQC